MLLFSCWKLLPAPGHRQSALSSVGLSALWWMGAGWKGRNMAGSKGEHKSDPRTPLLPRAFGFFSVPKGTVYTLCILLLSHNRAMWHATYGAMDLFYLTHPWKKNNAVPPPSHRLMQVIIITILIFPTTLRLNSFKILQVVKTIKAIILKISRMGPSKACEPLTLHS